MPTHVLLLNNMRSSKFERRTIAAEGSAEDLEALLESERVEPYRDDRWFKSFRAGGPLEWFNPPTRGIDQPIVAVPQGEPDQTFADGFIAAWRHFAE